MRETPSRLDLDLLPRGKVRPRSLVGVCRAANHVRQRQSHDVVTRLRNTGRRFGEAKWMVLGVTHLVAHFRKEENGVVQCREVGLAGRSRPRRCRGGRADNGMGRRVLTPVHGFDSGDLHDENKEAQGGRAGRRRQTTVEAYTPTVDVDRHTT